ncbi:uncharacterized protein LOC116850322 isoform X1 [Odontomachus brunneus]|uniref:uncharacterized protein LOC116850322 isoform X1 n=1 Tax=Odontomachus brunneus TaxID=486640 RepID=UPI0013F2112D|nr:uncharacterized protein LOC116850322 isoform X1 [Odontomachus brunneus]
MQTIRATPSRRRRGSREDSKSGSIFSVGFRGKRVAFSGTGRDTRIRASSREAEQDLRALLREFEEMRQERTRMREEFAEVHRRCDEESQRRHCSQLSPPNNISNRDERANMVFTRENVSREAGTHIGLGSVDFNLFTRV